MEEQIITEGKYRYIEKGEGVPIIILHGLMGGLSNFRGVSEHFPLKRIQSIDSRTPDIHHAVVEDQRQKFCQIPRKIH